MLALSPRHSAPSFAPRRSCAPLAVLAAFALESAAALAQSPETEVACSEATEPIGITYGAHTTNCSISQVTDLDQFQFSAGAGELVRIIGRSLEFGLDLRIEIFDPQGKIEDQFCNGGPGTVQCTLAIERPIVASGTHTLLVSDLGVNEPGDYVLQLERIPPAAPPPDLVYDLPLADSLDPETDVDFLAFVGAAGTQVRFSVSSQTFGLDPRLEVRDPSGSLLLDQFCDGGPGTRRCPVVRDLGLTLSGSYLIALSDVNSDEVGDYVLQLQRIPPAAPPRGLAYDLPLIDSVDPETDVDFFAFEGAEATLFRFAVSSQTFGLDPRLEVRDPSGALLLDTFCDGGPGTVRCSLVEDLEPTLSGSHLIALSDVNSDEVGSYEVSLTCISLGGTCPVPEPSVAMLELVALLGVAGLARWSRRA